jgi:hypothetical protein
MVVGSKVRMLHGFGEGIITKIEKDQAMVLLNEGLEIPIRIKDLVLIAVREEKKQVESAEKQGSAPVRTSPNRMFFVKEGIFLCGFIQSNNLVNFSIVNHTDFNLTVVVFKLGRPLNQFLGHMLVEPKSVYELNEAFPIQNSNHLTGLSFQILRFHPNQNDPFPIKENSIVFSKVDWKKTISTIPILEKEGYLIQLDGEIQKIDADELKNSLLSQKINNQPEPKRNDEFKKLEWREIDLHIEKLRSDYGNLSAREMLDVQLAEFDKAFDKALVSGIGKLIVIHGIGSGILKSEIHKRLSSSNHIKSFKEGRKEKFGYGATEIQF